MNVSGITAATSTVATKASYGPNAAASATSSANGSAKTTALYSSPVQTFDPLTGMVVVETRNVNTGQVLAQTPSKVALQYQRAQMLAAQKAAIRGAKIASA